MDYYYVYVLQSEKDGKNYTGYTKNLKLRFERHNKGLVESTKNRRPFKLIYFEGCLNQQDATHREKYLKTHYGKIFTIPVSDNGSYTEELGLFGISESRTKYPQDLKS